jgi:hypothetical protein
MDSREIHKDGETVSTGITLVFRVLVPMPNGKENKKLQ